MDSTAAPGPPAPRLFEPKPRPTLTLPPAPPRGPVVTPIDWSAGDRLTAQCFWASTDKDDTAWTCSEAEVQRVLNFGMKAQPVVHGTPFGHGHLTIHVDRVPLPIAGQLIRHRVQTISGDGSSVDLDWGPNVSQKSYRYVLAGGPDPELAKVSDLFWLPEASDLRTQKGRAGQYVFEPMERTQAEHVVAGIRHSLQDSWDLYLDLIDRGLAPEQARMLLPQGTLTRLYLTASYRNWLTWLVQRNDSHAQKEIRQVADQVEAIIEQCIPITYGLWLSHGRRTL